MEQFTNYKLDLSLIEIGLFFTSYSFFLIICIKYKNPFLNQVRSYNMGKMILLCVMVCIFFLLYMVWEAFRNRIIEHTLFFPDLPNSFSGKRVFFISDIHRRIIPQQLIDQIESKVDYVIIGGDLTEKGVPLSKTKENLTLLTSMGPTFFVWGNNDYEVDLTKFRHLLNELNVKILENQSETLFFDEKEQVNLIGIGEVSFELDDINKALRTVDSTAFNIICCHNPRILSKIKSSPSTRLFLCGHTHGGQINFFGKGIYPVGKLYHLPLYDVLISNGYGTTKLPMRFWAKSEVHLITLKRGERKTISRAKVSELSKFQNEIGTKI